MNEVCWLQDLLSELRLRVALPSTVFGDNQSAIAVSKNGVKGERTKHVDLKYSLATDLINEGRINLEWIPTDKQQADVFTKALGKQPFEGMRDLIMSPRLIESKH
jgi:hypothetical protein